MRHFTLLVTIIGLLSVDLLTAQVIRNQSQPTQANFLSFQAQQQRFGKRNANSSANNTYATIGEFDGSPFVFSSPVPATIVSNDGERFRVRYFSVDAYTDEFVVSEEAELSMDNYIWLEKGEIDRVEVEEKTDESVQIRTFVHIKAGEKSEPLGICEVLYSDEENGMQILKKHEAKFIRGRKGTNVIADVPPKFRSGEEMYSLVQGEGLNKLKKEKDFIKLFGSDQKRVKSMMKKMKLDYQDPKDIQYIFSSLNSDSE